MRKPKPLKLSPAELTRSRLALASKHITVEQAAAWTKQQREAADKWAMREHLVASDNDHLRRLKMPPHVEALPDLTFDGLWTEMAEPRENLARVRKLVAESRAKGRR